MIALTIAGSAPRQMNTLVPATSSSIECGRVEEAGRRFRDTPPAAAASTTTGTKPSASAPSCALRRASRRHVNSCCGVAPYRRATSETTAPGSRDASTARDFSLCDQRRRRPPPPVITSTRRPVAAFGSSVWSSLDTSRSPIQEITLPQPASDPKVRPGHRLLSNRVFNSYDNLLDHCCEA